MKGLLLLLVITVAGTVADGLPPGVRVRFDQVGTPGVTHFFKVPVTVAEAKEEGWKKTCRPAGPLQELVMYCSSDKVVCALMDDTNYIAGLQIAIKRDTFDSVFDWRKRGFVPWTIRAANGEITRFWTLSQFYVSRDFLQKSRRQRIAERDDTRILQEGAIWLAGGDGDVISVSTSDDEIKNYSPFTEQACIPWMGQHYYYNMTTTTECTADQMYPWFVMTNNGELSTTGFVTFGNKDDLEEGQRDWFEHPAEAVVRAIVPNGPECLYAMPTLTMHVYFTSDPTLITC